MLNGEKTATSRLSELAEESNLVGEIWSIRNSKDVEVCRVEVVDIRRVPFGDVDEAFALLEGDGSYDNWYEIHHKYYGELLQREGLVLDDETMLECVYFETILQAPSRRL